MNGAKSMEIGDHLITVHLEIPLPPSHTPSKAPGDIWWAQEDSEEQWPLSRRACPA